MTGERIWYRNYQEFEAAIAGKTIAASRFNNHAITVRFTDGTWFHIQHECYDVDDGPEIAEPVCPDEWELCRTGIITPEERDAIREQRITESKALERAEYERLKKKFEGEGA